MWVVYIFFNCLQKKTHANPTIINEKIKEIHILAVGGVPGISNFKSRASPPCFVRAFEIRDPLMCMLSCQGINNISMFVLY